MFDKILRGRISLVLCLVFGLGGLSFLPTDSYVYPLDGYVALAGTFGELRNNHFHSGIDIKTYRKIGIPVKAASSGYVYRLKTSPFGFGRAVYIKHDDGNFSVYAHLDRFIDTYGKLIYSRQLESETYEQEIYLPKDTIRVEKGQVIGYSGNSGSSYGPHLHFEIRDKDERIINPLKYYPEKVKDDIRPIVQEIAFEPLEIDSRVEGKWAKLRQTPINLGAGKYKINDLIHVKGRFGVEYMAYDKLNAAANKCGINYAELYLDGKLVEEFRLDTFGFDESRHINIHIDFDYYKKARRKFQRTYVLNGNKFSGYKYTKNRGILELTDDDVHNFTLKLRDFAGNESIVLGRLTRDRREKLFPSTPRFYTNARLSAEEKHGVLKITASNPTASMQDGLRYRTILGEELCLPPAYYIGREMVFLLELNRYAYPKELFYFPTNDSSKEKTLEFNFYEELFPDQNNLVELDELQVFFPYRTIFSHQHLEVKKFEGDKNMYSNVFRIGNAGVPINTSYLVSFKAPKNGNFDKMLVASWDGSKWEYAGNVKGNGKTIYASLKEFGKFCLMADSTQPTIRSVNFSDNSTIGTGVKSLVLAIDDDFSGIDNESIRGELDGKWVPFEYFFRQDRIRYDFSERRPNKGSHTLVVSVKDNTGNEKQVSYKLRF